MVTQGTKLSEIKLLKSELSRAELCWGIIKVEGYLLVTEFGFNGVPMSMKK